MITLAADIETDGFLDECTKIHSLCMTDVRSGDSFSCTDNTSKGPSISEGLEILQKADRIIFHNGITFDAPAIKKLYGMDLSDKVYDTLLVSRLIYTNLVDKDLSKTPRVVSGRMIGAHSLKAWGLRLGLHKGEIETDWRHWSHLMQAYCEQDVAVTVKLYKMFQVHKYSERAINLEHEFAKVIFRQEQRGFSFDYEAATELYVLLTSKRNELYNQLIDRFGTWYEKGKDMRPKRTLNYKDKLRASTVKDAPWTEVKHYLFNPASRQQIANRLTTVYGWKPKEFTDKGQAKLDETIFKKMDGIPEAPLLAEYFLLNKRIGQIAEGEKAWLKLFNHATGAIHGRVITNGAVTGRCTHSSPNVAQTPAIRAPYGEDCRKLFKSRRGFKLVGTDASSLEVRMLASYMGSPEYIDIVVNGDIHTANQKAAGLPDRDTAKTFIYALIYGGGDGKIGEVVGGSKKQGKELKARFLSALPMLQKLINRVQREAKARGYLVGLDGRRIHSRSAHSALNALLQGGGAVLMKEALVVLDKSCKRNGWVAGIDYEFVANVHDEWQAEVRSELVERWMELSNASIRIAGENLGCLCPMAGESKVGNNWAECH